MTKPRLSILSLKVTLWVADQEIWLRTTKFQNPWLVTYSTMFLTNTKQNYWVLSARRFHKWNGEVCIFVLFLKLPRVTQLVSEFKPKSVYRSWRLFLYHRRNLSHQTTAGPRNILSVLNPSWPKVKFIFFCFAFVKQYKNSPLSFR